MVDRSRLDPDSAAPLDALLAVMPGGFNAISDIVQRRAVVSDVMGQALAAAEPDPRVEWSNVHFAGPGGELRARVYRPREATGLLPGLVYIHGGGMIMGDLDGEHLTAERFCGELGAVVISLDYRKAPEHPYPAAPEDCYAGLQWVVEHADDFGIDARNIGAYGGSAGGGLVLAIALMSRDRRGPRLKYMMPIYPMVDDRHGTPSSQEITDVGLWDLSTSIEAWNWYLSGQEPDGYAAPARCADLTGLPPAFIDVGELDMFRDEDFDIAMRLSQAGVPTEFHVYPGAYHASEVFAPEAELSARIIATRLNALRRFMLA